MDKLKAYRCDFLKNFCPTIEKYMTFQGLPWTP